jgi:hypothetical protein
MAKSLDEIQEMLDALPSKEFRFDLMKDDGLALHGALRTKEGQNVIEPAPESASFIVGLRGSIEFLSQAPQIVQQLLDEARKAESA